MNRHSNNSVPEWSLVQVAKVGQHHMNRFLFSLLCDGFAKQKSQTDNK